MERFGASILRACAGLATRRPWAILGVAFVLTIAAAYASTRLTLDTGIEGILSRDLPFRQVEERYRAAFPEEERAIVVVDAPSAGGAEAAAAGLAGRLQARPNLFAAAEVVGASPFLDRIALLFLSPAEIEAFGGRLREQRRLLTGLGRDPSLRGLARLLRMAEGALAEGPAPPALAGALTDLAAATEQVAAGEPARMRWRDVFGVAAGADATRRLVEATPVLDDTSLDRAGPALSALAADIAATRAEHPDARLTVTGLPALRQQELNDVFSGALYASGLSFVLVATSLILGIRSGRLIAALLITLVVGSIWTTGLAAISVGRLNLISVAFLVLFFGLGVDFGTHLGLRHLEEARRGAPFGEALTAAMKGEGAGIALSALCAALAFLAFVPTAYVGLAEFGIISALGMLVAVIVTFTVQPALMALMPPRPKAGTPVSIGIGRWIEAHHRAILAGAGLATAAAAWVALGARLDVDPLNLQNPRAEPVVAYRELAADPETSPYALNVLAPDLDAAAALALRLAATDGVAGVRSVADFVPADQPAKLAAIAAARERVGASVLGDAPPEPPPDDAALAQALADLRAAAAGIAAAPDTGELGAAASRLAAALDLFAARRGTDPAALRELGDALAGDVPPLLADVKAKLSVAAPVSIDDLPPGLRRAWIAPDGQVRLRVLPAGDVSGQAAMQRFARAVQAVAPGAYGAPVSILGGGDAILAAFLQAVAYTAVAIAAVVALLRRRLADVILVLAPLGTAAVWTVAASVLLDLPFNLANIIVIPLLIGLGVAGSVHIVVRAREIAHAAGAPTGAGVLDTSTPLAVLVAQLNTVGAFVTLAVSAHRGLFSMGVLLGVAIFFVMIACLVVLPAFMIAVRRGAPPPS